MLNSEERKIGEHVYRVKQLPGPAGMKLLVRLYKIMGPAVAEILRGVQEMDSDAGLLDLKLAMVADAVTDLAERIPEDELEAMVTKLAPTTEICTLEEDGQDIWRQLKDSKDMHFAGRYRELFLWLGFALEVNYADFFGGSEGLREKLSLLTAAPQESPSKSRKGSTGQSTGSRRRRSTTAA